MHSVWVVFELMRAARVAYVRHMLIRRICRGSSPEIAYILSNGLGLKSYIAMRKLVRCV